MRALTFALLIIAAAPAAAQEWLAFWKNPTFDYYLDPESIRVNGHLRRVWSLMNWKKPTGKGELSRRLLFEYDCTEERYRVLSWSWFTDGMATGTQFSGKSSAVEWQYIPPGDFHGNILKAVCAVN